MSHGIHKFGVNIIQEVDIILLMLVGYTVLAANWKWLYIFAISFNDSLANDLNRSSCKEMATMVLL